MLAALRAELAGVEALLVILEREQQMLMTGSIATLPELTTQKSTLVADIDKQSQARLVWFPVDAAARQTLFLQQPTIATAWAALSERANRAAALNQSNGLLINQRLQHNREALHILRGQETGQPTYGPDGQQQSLGSGRTLGSA